MTTRRQTRSLTPLAVAVGSALALAGCGGSGGGSDNNAAPVATPPSTPPVSSTPTPVGQTTVGKITGFGSVYVNGVRFDTSGSSYDVDDDDNADDSKLAVGMVVAVKGSVDGTAGVAEEIYYDDDLEGFVENLQQDPENESIKTFDVLGTTVRVEDGFTNFDDEDDDNFSFETIANGDLVEVSGEYQGDILVASYIEKQDDADDDIEVYGTITEYDGASQFVLLLRNERTLTVTLDSSAEIPDEGLADGQYVEVEGTIPDPVNAPDSILADRVELEDDDLIEDEGRDGEDVELEGTLNRDEETGDWSVREVTLAFTEDTDFDPDSLAERIENGSAAGLYVDVEGFYDGDVLVVEDISIEEDDLSFTGDATVTSSTGPRDGVITMTFGAAIGSVEIIVDPGTSFLDDEYTAPYNLSDIVAGTRLDIDARLADDGSIIAESISIEDQESEYAVEGYLDAIDEVSVTVSGISFGIDGETEIEGAEPVIGGEAEVYDEDADGVADVIELDD